MQYKDLSINQKINYKSGWDIAIAYEGAKTRDGKRYCKMLECIKAKNIHLAICEKDYNSKSKHRVFNGGRNLLTECYITR